MVSITKENAKYHCRTCLINLWDSLSNTNIKESLHDISEINNIEINPELEELMSKYLEETTIIKNKEFPNNLCLTCYDKLTAFNNFKVNAKCSTQILEKLFKNQKKSLDEDVLLEPETVIIVNSKVPFLTNPETLDSDPFGVPKIRNQPTRHFLANKVDFSELNYTFKVEDKIVDETNIKKNNNSDNVNKRIRRSRKEMEECRGKQLDISKKNRNNRWKDMKKDFKCSQCKSSFFYKVTLDAHIRKSHEGIDRPYQCDRCDKSYSHISSLSYHIKDAHVIKSRSFQCDYIGCERIFTSSIGVYRHKKLVHTKSEKRFVCEQCGLTYGLRSSLKRHRIEKHPTEAELAVRTTQKFECDVCKKSFRQRNTLKYHIMQLHTKDMKFECKICGKRMAKNFMLIKHMVVHSTNYISCEHCNKRFNRKHQLQKHISAVHLRIKPFQCQYCSKEFATRKHVRQHEYIHTGEKPHVCKICGKAFNQLTSLNIHKRTHEKSVSRKV